MELEDNPTHKVHRKSKVGVKAEKKKAKKQKNNDIEAQRERNPKSKKERQRKLDRMHKKEFLPVVDRTPLEPPPIIVAVQGPPGVGKTTLIKCMAKHYTHQAVHDLKGPLTLISGKKRRITFIEVPSKDLTAMVDISKVADLVLMVVDASFGFEMETFEFLNLLQQHGFPKVMGILTHLDHFHKQSDIRKTKKLLKKRFWGEIYQGAKMFYLSGMIHGKYLKRDIKNLARYISVQKYRPLTWRNNHPYLLVDRVEDITNPELIRQNDKCDRKVALFGYLHGTNLKKNQKIHIPGCGDFDMTDVSTLDDPCPLPPERRQRQKIQQKERLLYAPMSNIGQMLYDKDGVYIEIADHQVHFTDPSQHRGPGVAPTPTQGPGEKMVRELQAISTTVDENLDNMEFMLFSGSKNAVVLDTAKKAAETKSGEKNPDRVAVPPKKDYSIDMDDEDDSDEDDEDDVGSDNDMSGDEDDDDGSEDDEEFDSDIEIETPRGGKKSRKSFESKSEASPKKGKKVTDSSDEDAEDFGSFDDDSDDDSEEYESGFGKSEKSGGGSGSDSNSNSDSDEDDDDDDDESDDEDGEKYLKTKRKHKGDKRSDESDDEGALRWKEKLHEQAKRNFVNPVNLMKLVYGDIYAKKGGHKKEDDDEEGPSESSEEGFFKLKTRKDHEEGSSSSEESEDFFQAKSAKRKRDEKNEVETSRFKLDEGADELDLEDDEIKGLLESRFIPRDYIYDEKYDVGVTLGEDDENLFGDFEDLEDSSDDGGKKAAKKPEKAPEEATGKKEEELKDAKAKLKAAFDEEYDVEKKQPKASASAPVEEDQEAYFNDLKAKADEQRLKNLEAFKDLSREEQIALQGHVAGHYVRIEINAMPCEFIKYFDPRFPVIIGGLNPQEERVGMVQIRIKKHRWYKKILKTNDPLIISSGWRRFQTQPLFSIRDHNGRNRALKYTPEHMHCYATFWGPITPPNTGLVAFQYTYAEANSKNFNIAATGVVLELNQTFEIVKKLKLIGYPYEIKKNTAFIKDMFNSVLETNKFIGAKLVTVAGIRGQIKKAQHKPPGAFRATFEDRILKSDIVVLRTWYPIQPTKYYNPMTDLLTEERAEWKGMKTVFQLRKERDIPVPVQPDSFYKPITERAKSDVNMKVPKKLQAQLPYASLPKATKKRKRTTAEMEHAVVLEPKEREKLRAINQLMHLRAVKAKETKLKKKEKLAAFMKQKQRENNQREAITRENRKEMYRLSGLMKKDKERAAKRRRIN